jgi:[ribosomal protein S18]-alanine N-acetyltransferase
MRRPVDPEVPFRAGVFFRRAQLEDVGRVMEIEKEGFRHPWSRELIERELAHPWSQVVLAAEEGGGPVLGYIVFWLVHDEVHVLNVATSLASRRRGIGRALMVAAEEEGRRHGARLSTLEVRASNAPALSLYRAMGYRQVGVRPNYYAEEQEDAIVMVKAL